MAFADRVPKDREFEGSYSGFVTSDSTGRCPGLGGRRIGDPDSLGRSFWLGAVGLLSLMAAVHGTHSKARRLHPPH